MKKKLILMGIAGALVLSTMIGGTLAAFQANSTQGVSEIKTRNLEVKLSEGDNNGLARYSSGDLKLMPGAEADADVTISNTEENNYEAYIRVTVYKAWESDELDHNTIIITPADEWIVKSLDSQTTVYYYTKPVPGGTSTSAFISKVGVPGTLTNEYADQKFSIEAYAEAVQTMGGAAAIKSAWGVDVSIGDGGIITRIDGQSLESSESTDGEDTTDEDLTP